jgi:hypothetical protein
MRRREFITLLGGAAAGWPFAVRAQERTARIGALLSFTETNPESKGLVTAIEKQLNTAGWYKGRNLEIDYRWGASDPERFARDAEELVRAAAERTSDIWDAGSDRAQKKCHEYSNRVFGGIGSGRAGFRNQPSPSGRQRDRFFQLRSRHRWQMVATVKGRRPISDERHGDVQSTDIALQRLVDALN